jgi:hypothetical protein
MERDVTSTQSSHGGLVLDIAYILGTIGFFALMLAYVYTCDRLGRSTSEKEQKP